MSDDVRDLTEYRKAKEAAGDGVCVDCGRVLAFGESVAQDDDGGQYCRACVQAHGFDVA